MGLSPGQVARFVRLLPPSNLSLAPPVDTSLVLTRTYWGHGASSMAGGQTATTSNGGGVDVFTATADFVQTNCPTSTARVNRPIDYIPTSGGRINNRGVGGTGGDVITTTMVGNASGAGGSDFFFNQIGDNDYAGGLLLSGPNPVGLLMDSHATMLTAVAGRGFLQIVNTQGGRNAGGNSPEPPGTFWPSLKNAVLRRLNDINPGRAISFFETLRDEALFDPAVTSDDLTLDIEVGVSPRSYMQDGGGHMIAKGYNLVSDTLIRPIIDAVEGGTPFPVRQHITALRPAVPAANDVIGNIVVYGTGGTFAVDSSNTQTDYTVNADGQVRRLTATPPARDLVRMPVRLSKPGRADKVQRQIWVGERAAPGTSSLVEFDGRSVLLTPRSRLANTSRLTVLFRIQAVDTAGAIVFGGGSQCQIALTAAGGLDVVWRNPASTVIFSHTTPNVFRTTDPPRWVALCIDLTDPAAEIARLVHWSVPATATTFTQTTGALFVDTTTAFLARLDQNMAFAAAPANVTTGSLFSRFRIGHFHLWRNYIDFTVQANREIVSTAAGLPQSAWLSTSDGAVGGVVPDWVMRGNATDWREGRTLGIQEIGFSNRRRADGEFGFLTSVPG